MIRFLDERPSCGEILLNAFLDAGVPEDYFVSETMRWVVGSAMRGTLSRLKELGFDYWSLDAMSFPLVSGKNLYSIPANVIVLLDLRIAANSSPEASANAIIPITQAEYAGIPYNSLCGAPKVYTFNALAGNELALWPVPQASSHEPFIVCEALTWVRHPKWWEKWPPYRMESWLTALAAGLAYNIKMRWPVIPGGLEYLKLEAERAYRLATLVEE